MAAGDSQVSIVNIGLIELGERPISAMTDAVKAAIYASARYDQVRREVLRAHPWDCARAQAQLSTNVKAPLFGYANSYGLPADFIRMVRIEDGLDGRTPYEVMQRALLTDAGAPVDVVYIQDISDPTLFDPLLTAAMGYVIGAALAMPLTQSKTRRDDCLSLAEGKLAMARFVSSQDNSPPTWDMDILLGARA